MKREESGHGVRKEKGERDVCNATLTKASQWD